MVMLISTAPPIAVYAVSGMETLLYGLLIVSFLFTFIREERLREQHQRRFPLSGTLGALLCLTRPEGFIILGPFVVYRTIVAAVASTPDGRNQYFLWIGQIAGAVAGLIIWRLVYYGHLLPMPVYAKVTGEYGYRGVRQILGGTKYFLTFAKEYGGVVAIFLVLWAALREAAGYLVKLASTRGERPLREGEGRLVVAVFLLWYVFYCVNVGGDFMPQFRFYVPLLPIFYVSLVTRPLSDLLPRSCLVVACVALLGYNVLAIPYVSYNEISSRTHVIEKYKEMGDVLPGATLATSQAGALPYYTGFRTIDMMGLNEEYIAMAFRRSRGLLATDESVYGDVVEHILSQSPEVLHIGGGLKANRPYHEAIMNSEQFRENYKEWSDYSSQNDWFYVRKDIEAGRNVAPDVSGEE